MMVFLNQDKSLINLEGIRRVYKIGGGFDRANQYSHIKILYTDNTEVTINYGSDDHYDTYETRNSNRRDLDFAQLVCLLVKKDD